MDISFIGAYFRGGAVEVSNLLGETAFYNNL